MISLDGLKEKFEKLFGAFTPRDTFEGEIFRSMEIVELQDLANEVRVRVKVKVLEKWLDLEGKLSLSVVFSVVDEVTPVVQMIFSNRQATSVEIKISMIERDICGRVLYGELICNKPKSEITQTFIKIYDEKKLIAVASHNKIYLKQEYKIPKL